MWFVGLQRPLCVWLQCYEWTMPSHKVSLDISHNWKFLPQVRYTVDHIAFNGEKNKHI
jgi:hypothetical protein